MRLFTTLFPVLVLAACASHDDEQATPLPVQEPTVKPESVAEQPVSGRTINSSELVWTKSPLKLQQRLTVEVDGASRQAMAFLSLSDDVIEMQLFDPLGLPVETIKWINGQPQEIGATKLPAPVTPNHILDDIVVAFWPYEELAPLLNSGLSVAQDGRGRSVRQGLQSLVTVTYSETADPLAELTINNHQHGYILRISSAEVS